MSENRQVLKRVLYADSTRNPLDVIAKSRELLKDNQTATVQLIEPVKQPSLEVLEEELIEELMDIIRSS
jgi:hypothetical protein